MMVSITINIHTVNSIILDYHSSFSILETVKPIFLRTFIISFGWKIFSDKSFPEKSKTLMP